MLDSRRSKPNGRAPLISKLADELPIGGELLSIEQLEKLAEDIAVSHEVSKMIRPGRNMLARLGENQTQLVADYKVLTEAAEKGDSVTPAAEWFVDNFHIVEEQLREVRQDLPGSFYRELPKLETGEFKNYPRIFQLAIEIIAHTDNNFESRSLHAFIESYQRISPLNMGELWAFPITLRLGLIENLRRYADKIVKARSDRATADKFADRLAEDTSEDLSVESLQLISTTFDNRNIEEETSATFIAQLTARLREGNRLMTFALDKIETVLRRRGETIEHLAHLEHNRQAAAQISVANIITSMRLLSTLDWQEFFERTSFVDRILQNDPAGVYALMDFATRDQYRHQIERIAKKTRAGEIDVAHRAVDIAGRAMTDNGKAESENLRLRHVGYFLHTDEGLSALEKSFSYRLGFSEYAGRIVRLYPTAVYLTAVGVLSGMFAAGATYTALYSASYTVLVFILVLLLSITPAGELAITIVNWTITVLLKPRLLPKMDFRKGIPEKARTIVVIPTLLTNKATIEELFEHLEIYHLANRDKQIYFAMLGDLTDAKSEINPEDEVLRHTAREFCAELNKKYESKEKPRFLFFSRHRQWNAGENAWICRERKRGNLHEFNQILRGAVETSFDLTESPDFEFLKTIRYVITLDADTQLPRDAAHKLIGTIEHPLNRPIFDESAGRVIAGYGILQPRIEISLTSAARSPFARIFSAGKGFDPYTTAVSDVYQDLFGEGNYVGKGLYDVDAFEAALDRRIPENKLLSHDLFEGLYARVALVSDIVFYDDYPSGYYSFSQRLHRWTRGDWQIMRWLLPFAPDADGRIVRNRLPMLARWKIRENLRRSLVAFSILLWLVFAWTILPLSPLISTLFAFIVLTAPLYLQIASAPVVETTVGIKQSIKLQFINLLNDIKLSAIQLLLRFAFLAHEAYTTTDAIARVLYRKFISGKNLLEWVTAAQSDEADRKDLYGYYRSMLFAPVSAALIFGVVTYRYPHHLVFASPFLILWFFSPLVAFWLSRMAVERQAASELDQKDIEWLRLIARRTWRFFETFVGESDHWLPPDNFQQEPTPITAHRTSPTNIGLLLLSTLAARDFGYLGTLETIERIELTCTTLERLPRFRGHFYNWYDTQTLEPLKPQYISTVDSGNLVGSLIAVAEGCQEFTDLPLFDQRTRNGLLDTLAFLKTEGESLMEMFPPFLQLVNEIETAERVLRNAEPKTAGEWKSLFRALENSGKSIRKITEQSANGEERLSELEFWTTSFLRLTSNYGRDLDMLMPVDDAPETITRSKEIQRNFRVRIESVASLCRGLANETEFGFLYDEERKVLTIGYRPDEGVRDNSFYDLLASEARLASFIAIASGDVEREHWFRLGRGLVRTNGSRALVSWSGTMFEYLMPLLLMRDYKNTLLSETYRTIVARQIQYGEENKLPWGVSESAYNVRDLQLNYQYGPFGVPGLGLKRGLAEDLVISPYATALALTLVPSAGVTNLRRLQNEGMLGPFGFYEAVDYTKERLPPNQKFALIESYMAHHQGMTLVALDNLLSNEVMVNRFHHAPVVESAELLLQERIPRLQEEAKKPRAAAVSSGRRSLASVAPEPRRYTSAEQFAPPVCLLSNGNYTAMLTTAGSGYSRVGARSITRWREDTIRDDWGQFFYLRDLRSGAVWSGGFQPVLRQPHEYEAIFTESKAEFRRRDAGILTHIEIIVATEDDAELRRITLTNESTRIRHIEVTSYGEIVLNEQAADEAHPAFTNLFVETEYDAERRTIFARRRPRSTEDKAFWLAHTVAVEGDIAGGISFETDRSRFIGRGRTTNDPVAANSEENLSGTVGATLDPIFALRAHVSISPNKSVSLIFSTSAAESREQVVASVDKYCHLECFQRAEKLAWTRSQVELQHLGISRNEANLFQRLAGHLIYTNPRMRPLESVLRLNRGTPQTLWKYGISGDLPIMIVRVDLCNGWENSVSQILRAHEYLRSKGLIFDLVIFNDQPTSYAQGIKEDLLNLIRRSAAHSLIDARGGVFIRRSEEMPEEDRVTLHTAARICFVVERGSLEEQLGRRVEQTELPSNLIPREASRSYERLPQPGPELIFPNDFGGFSEDGREYTICLNDKNPNTPVPWTNVVANEKGFGFIAAESGIGIVWSNNSHENRLTPWTNDAVVNQPSECIYLRDEATGSFWTPTALPVRENSEYKIRHGSGYTIYENTSHGIKQELLVFAAVDSSIKISRLRVQNLTDRHRELSVTFYCDLVLGVERAKSAPFIITEIDSVTGAIFARNPNNTEFSDRVAFIATDSLSRTWTCDRREFLGRNGNLARPAAMFRENLSGSSGAGLNPCAAVQSKFELEPNETREIIFLLGEEDKKGAARESILHFRQHSSVATEYGKIVESWNKTLDVIKVKTPDKKLDLLLNHWLVYQTLSCRFWARTSVYQSSGAYGFRDQLQDAMTLVYSRPDLARHHLLRAASRQFKEGDVQHWWHEPSGAGTRTRISDNLLWLVLVTNFYVDKTGDAGVLDENIPFLDAPVLPEGEMEVYIRPVVSGETASLFEHCVRAVERSLTIGEHGLPLIGAGDWSDGLNRVGTKGKGESVWMGWFLAKILNDFAPVCERRGEGQKAKKYRAHAKLLTKNLEANAWDGDWYLRAFFDDGTPLGSHTNDECKIDSIAQSWSLISGLGDPKRQKQAVKSVGEHLIRKDENLALLLTPPFDSGELEPGYIKGYPPGIRENGGQYTHAACWMIIAYALLGEGEKAYELFSMMNPINHTLTGEAINRYKTEPYVVAADIYSHPKHIGRGGWTWYTGSASWMYRAALESLLGFCLKGNILNIEPCIPRSWNGFEIDYRHGRTLYQIRIENPSGICRGVIEVSLDGKLLPSSDIPLMDDELMHKVKVIMGELESIR